MRRGGSLCFHLGLSLKVVADILRPVHLGVLLVFPPVFARFMTVVLVVLVVAAVMSPGSV